MTMQFKSSAQSTLGIEWELALVDQSTATLSPTSRQVLDKLSLSSDSSFRIVEEFLLNTLELVTGVCHTVTECLDQLAQAGNHVLDIIDGQNLGLYAQGSHPFAEPLTEVVSGEDRYQKMLDRTQWWGQQMVIYGVHTHIGLDHQAKAMPAINHLINHYPHLLALSASSPFWQSHHTGYVSQRSQIFQQLPTSGLPFQYEQWSGFENTIDELIHVGVIDDVTEARWDIRPVPRFGTVEVRVCDGMATLKEVGAVSALTQCLVHEAVGTDTPGFTPEIMQPWFVQENKWRAARYGLDALVIINPAGDEVLVTDHLMQVLNRLEPIAQQLGCTRELGWVEDLMSDQEPARRQLSIAGNPTPGDKIAAESLKKVVLDASHRTAESLRQWPSILSN